MDRFNERAQIKKLKDLVVELAESIRSSVSSEYSVDIRYEDRDDGDTELYHRAYRVIERKLPK